LRDVLNRPDFVEQQIVSKGLQLVASTPEELGSVVQKETVSLKTIIGTTNIQPE
jgi:hypothetical protein